MNLSVRRWLRTCYLVYFSQPASDRICYRTIRKRKSRRILEVGIGTGLRSLRMLEAAKFYSPIEQIVYVGIDPFEGDCAPSGPRITLKTAYRLLRATGAKVRLLPGDSGCVFAKYANALGTFDLVVISGAEKTRFDSASWFYLPRMLSKDSRVLLADRRASGNSFRQIPLAEIQSLADAARRRAA
jgi:predicted O-methyltransferase YrrM